MLKMISFDKMVGLESSPVNNDNKGKDNLNNSFGSKGETNDRPITRQANKTSTSFYNKSKKASTPGLPNVKKARNRSQYLDNGNYNYNENHSIERIESKNDAYINEEEISNVTSFKDPKIVRIVRKNKSFV